MQSKTHRRLLTQLAGDGWILQSGARIARVSYAIDVWQTYTVVREKEVCGGMQELDITVTGPLDEEDLEHVPLTLLLADGRRIDGFLDETGFVALRQLEQA